MIFRNDDVNPNSNLDHIKEIYSIIKEYFPEAEIYSCITILGKTTDNGSAYPEIDIKKINFPDVDKMFDLNKKEGLENIVSHGLFHLDHRNASKDLQEHSIVSSCRILGTNIFIPPFWRWNYDTSKICDKHGIKLWVGPDWINIERNPIDKDHKYYLFHSWRFTPETFRERMKIICQST